MRTQSTIKRLAGLAALTALIGGGLITGAASAVAKPAPGQGGGQHVHQAPRTSFVVDGVRYAPEQISKFNGRPLYFVVDLASPGAMTGYTNESDARGAVTALNRKSSAGAVQPMSAGQYATLYSGDEMTGDSMSLNSPYGINYLAGVNRGCGLFGCAGHWEDVASSLYVNGRVSVYSDIEYRGSWLYFAGNGYANLSWYGFDNITSSMNVWW